MADSPKWASLATWFTASSRQHIILDGRALSSTSYNAAPTRGGAQLQIFKNYFVALRERGGGLVLGTDHGVEANYPCGHFTCGINEVTETLNIGKFWGSFIGDSVAYVDVGAPLVSVPFIAYENAVARGKTNFICNSSAHCVVGTVFDQIVWDHSSTAETAIGLQPNGMTFYAAAFHSADTSKPAISSTIRGLINFQVALVAPECDQCYAVGDSVTLAAEIHVPSVGPYTGWTAQHLGGGTNSIPNPTAFVIAADGLSATMTTLPLTEGDHGFEVQVTDNQGSIATATARVSARFVPHIAQSTIIPASTIQLHCGATATDVTVRALNPPPQTAVTFCASPYMYRNKFLLAHALHHLRSILI